MDVLCMTWPLPANPAAQNPDNAGLHFGEELEVSRQQGKSESLT